MSVSKFLHPLAETYQAQLRTTRRYAGMVLCLAGATCIFVAIGELLVNASIKEQTLVWSFAQETMRLIFSFMASGGIAVVLGTVLHANQLQREESEAAALEAKRYKSYAGRSRKG